MNKTNLPVLQRASPPSSPAGNVLEFSLLSGPAQVTPETPEDKGAGCPAGEAGSSRHRPDVVFETEDIQVGVFLVPSLRLPLIRQVSLRPAPTCGSEQASEAPLSHHQLPAAQSGLPVTAMRGQENSLQLSVSLWSARGHYGWSHAHGSCQSWAGACVTHGSRSQDPASASG